MKEFLKRNKDKVICILLMLIFFLTAIINLGKTKMPETEYESMDEDILTIILEEQADVRKIVFFNGIGEGNVEINYGTNVLAKRTQDYANVLQWEEIGFVDFITDNIEIELSDDVRIKEIGLIDENNEFIKIKEIINKKSNEKIIELYDEQNTLIDVPTYHNGTYFDEVYYARAAEEFFDGEYIFENTHPPMGKNIIFLGIKIFGNSPFGWRIMGVIFATAMIGILYYFAKNLFGKTRYAIIASLLLVFDFLHFSMSRICTIDTYVAFFILTSYFLTYKYYKLEFGKEERATNIKKIIYILLVGVFIGLTVSVKWNGAFGLVGIAIVFLYILIKKYVLTEKSLKSTLRTIGIYAVLLIIIPIIVYLLSYIPNFISKGETYSISTIIQEQFNMFDYHSMQRETHPYQSYWWQWLYDYKPLFASVDYISDAQSAVIYFFMNPILIVGNALSIVFLIGYLITKKIKKQEIYNKETLIYILLGAVTTILPWIFIKRSTYIYHFYPTLLFVILLITYIINILEKNQKRKWVGIVFVIMLITCFIAFYPIISGTPFGEGYTNVMNVPEEWIWLPTVK